MDINELVKNLRVKCEGNINAVSASFEARNKVAAVSSFAFAHACYEVIRADKNAYDRAIEVERMETVCSLLCAGISEQDVLYLVDRDCERAFAHVYQHFPYARPLVSKGIKQP